jgi:small neutral amino acid transporter SnatA (MarC family)
MDQNFFSALVILLLVLDPLGNLPVVLSLLKNIPREKRRGVIMLECLIAFSVLLIFMLTGRAFLQLIHLSERALEVAGGVILFMVAIRLVFPGPSGVFGDLGDRPPLIFPLAIPLIAGPSAMATVLLMASRQPERMLEWVAALACAMASTTIILLSGGWLLRILGEAVLSAIEKLMGLILTAVAVEMILAGTYQYFMTQ